MKLFAEVVQILFWKVFGFTPFAFYTMEKSYPGFIFYPVRLMFPSDD